MTAAPPRFDEHPPRSRSRIGLCRLAQGAGVVFTLGVLAAGPAGSQTAGSSPPVPDELRRQEERRMRAREEELRELRRREIERDEIERREIERERDRRR